jgi:Epoxide hydrolase N terminus
MIDRFTVHFPQDAVDDLTTRLRNTRWPDAIVDSGWTYGASLAYMKELVGYWQNAFSWRKTEELINSFPNFKFTTEETTIHFIYIKGKKRECDTADHYAWLARIFS